MTVIDVEKELQRDQRANLGDLLYGKVPGVFGAYNTWGTGNSVILVDGIPQGSFYLSSLSLLEIESVVVLKDALSKSMYGAQGDGGVILVNTKRGKEGKHKLRVIGEFGGASPRAMPSYLNAPDYMEKYNQAQLNDGVDPSTLRYTQ
ncbi:MAG: TonB-dependent receptor plug domain-containing protein, partial [Bacteroidales bacterium]|jgi:TonB-dependent SusC/RagA subfamily outer membrane receptor|nr:TonB-dependent receptor plug domain-containing protein [Bacteroidales bacterium]